MSTFKKFEDLDVWIRARALCNEIHTIALREPMAKDFGLKDQMNRSSGSIMDNIAEGFERDGRKEFIQFLSYAKASSAELRSQLYRAADRGYINDEEHASLNDSVLGIAKMISGFIGYLKKCEVGGLKYKGI